MEIYLETPGLTPCWPTRVLTDGREDSQRRLELAGRENMAGKPRPPGRDRRPHCRKRGGTGCLRPGLAASFVLACLLRGQACGGLHQVMKRARNRCAMCGKAHAYICHRRTSSKCPCKVTRMCTTGYNCNYRYKFKKNPVWDAGAWLVFHWLTSAGPHFLSSGLTSAEPL